MAYIVMVYIVMAHTGAIGVSDELRAHVTRLLLTADVPRDANVLEFLRASSMTVRA